MCMMKDPVISIFVIIGKWQHIGWGTGCWCLSLCKLCVHFAFRIRSSQGKTRVHAEADINPHRKWHVRDCAEAQAWPEPRSVCQWQAHVCAPSDMSITTDILDRHYSQADTTQYTTWVSNCCKLLSRTRDTADQQWKRPWNWPFSQRVPANHLQCCLRIDYLLLGLEDRAIQLSNCLERSNSHRNSKIERSHVCLPHWNLQHLPTALWYQLMDLQDM